MTDKERLNEAYDWLAYVRKLVGETKDEEYFQRRLTTLEWLIEQVEKAERYEKALKEIMKVNEKHEWNLYGLAYAIAERAILD